jgi:thiosulfate/3-mercaptopyruvate sulfurtransferase
MTSPLISTDELALALRDPALRIVDGSWHMDGTDGRAAHADQRIPGAVFFDIDAVSDRNTDLPHMLPTPEDFGKAAGALGLTATDPIVVYDSLGLFSAARVWWSLRTMGARNVRVLDGGMPKWLSEGRPVETGAPPAPHAAHFSVSFDAARVADKAAISANIDTVIDARSAARFEGAALEPRPGLRPGHMPGARNLPFGRLMGPDGVMQRGAALRAVFEQAGVDLDRPVITSCGSGVTAAVVSLALVELGHDSRLYDGSWAEWGAAGDTAVVTGPA